MLKDAIAEIDKQAREYIAESEWEYRDGMSDAANILRHRIRILENS